ncbi:MAG: hypothetical protein ACREJ2_01665 [Planctomycetota bacterium]
MAWALLLLVPRGADAADKAPWDSIQPAALQAAWDAMHRDPPDLKKLAAELRLHQDLVNADVQYPDVSNGQRHTTLLIEAVVLDNTSMVRVLLANGCSINRPDRQGFTPLMVCLVPAVLWFEDDPPSDLNFAGVMPSADLQLATLLLNEGANLEEAGPDGSTVLELAKRYDFPVATGTSPIEFLLAHGADPRRRTAALRAARAKYGLFMDYFSDPCECKTKEAAFLQGNLPATTVLLYHACKRVPPAWELAIVGVLALAGVGFLRQWSRRPAHRAALAARLTALRAEMTAHFQRASTWDAAAALPPESEIDGYLAGEARAADLRLWLWLPLFWAPAALALFLLDPLLPFMLDVAPVLGFAAVYLLLHGLLLLKTPPACHRAGWVLSGATFVAAIGELYLMAYARMNFNDAVQVIYFFLPIGLTLLQAILYWRLGRIAGGMRPLYDRMTQLQTSETEVDFAAEDAPEHWDERVPGEGREDKEAG